MGVSTKSKTVAVHAGARRIPTRSESLVPAIEMSAVSYFEDSDDLDRSFDGQDFVYGRIRAQTAELLEQAVAALEGAEDCVAYASGMAALKAVLEAQPLKAGDTVALCDDGYGATRASYTAYLDARGIALHALPLSSPNAPELLRRLAPRFVLAESVSNPLLSVPNLPALAEACRAVGATFAVDGTFSSPAVQRTLSQGADLAIQSTTKWLNGHSDATGGTVSGKAEAIRALKRARVLDGAVLGPFEAWLTLRGIRTLPVRMQAHCEHALHVARRLSADSRLARVIYPGLPSHPHHAVAQRLMTSGFGGMLAFEISGVGRKEVFRFLESVKLCRPAPSLGDVTTLVMHPATASARRLSPTEREAAGIQENLVRVSVGLEDPDDIADDLLAAVTAAVR